MQQIKRKQFYYKKKKNMIVQKPRKKLKLNKKPNEYYFLKFKNKY